METSASPEKDGEEFKFTNIHAGSSYVRVWKAHHHIIFNLSLESEKVIPN